MLSSRSQQLTVDAEKKMAVSGVASAGNGEACRLTCLQQHESVWGPRGECCPGSRLSRHRDAAALNRPWQHRPCSTFLPPRQGAAALAQRAFEKAQESFQAKKAALLEAPVGWWSGSGRWHDHEWKASTI